MTSPKFVPPFRRLRGYAFDPSLSYDLDTAVLNAATFKVRWERLERGPTGEYLEVTIAPGAKPEAGFADASHYVVRGQSLEIALWYRREDDRWLALDSIASNGGLLSYRSAGDAPPPSPEGRAHAHVSLADLTAD